MGRPRRDFPIRVIWHVATCLLSMTRTPVEGVPRSSTVRDPQRAYGSILGEITVGRGAFSVAGIDQVIVGTPSGREFWMRTVRRG